MFIYVWETCVCIYFLQWACSDSSKQLWTFNTPGNLRALSVKRFLRSIFSSLQHIEIKVTRESLNKRKQMHIHIWWNWFMSNKWIYTLLNRITYLHSVNSNQQARGKLTRDINAKVWKVKKNIPVVKHFFVWKTWNWK